MSLAAVLENACPSLARKWTARANAVYPFAATGFLLTKDDPFANPVGRRTLDLAPLLCRAVLGLAHDEAAFTAALEEFVRVRAVQDVPAESSLRAVFALKKMIRETCAESGIALTPDARDGIDAMDERCDEVALLAFSLYSRFRDAFFEARVQDVRRRHSQILRLAERRGLADSAPDESVEPSGPVSVPASGKSNAAEKTR